MDLKRFFCDSIIDRDKEVVLEGQEFYHAVKVTRHKVGYDIIVCDNTGYDYYCKITQIEKDFLKAKVERTEKNLTENAIPLNLFIGNNKDLDSAVQKAVELGVENIYPFLSSRCNTKEINYARLEKIILESSKQCGRAVLAKIHHQKSFEECVIQAKNDNVCFFYEFENEKKVVDFSIDNKKPVNYFIGPEGGFAEDEINFAKENGISTFSLGKRIMRVSTAVVAGAILLNEKIIEATN